MAAALAIRVNEAAGTATGTADKFRGVSLLPALNSVTLFMNFPVFLRLATSCRRRFAASRQIQVLSARTVVLLPMLTSPGAEAA